MRNRKNLRSYDIVASDPMGRVMHTQPFSHSLNENNHDNDMTVYSLKSEGARTSIVGFIP